MQKKKINKTLAQFDKLTKKRKRKKTARKEFIFYKICLR